MKIGFVGCVAVALVTAVLACAQAVAGELPSQSAAPAAAGQPGIQADGGGLTAEQSLALATIAPAEEAYGSSNDTAEMIVLYAVCVAAVVVTAIILSHGL